MSNNTNKSVNYEPQSLFVLDGTEDIDEDQMDEMDIDEVLD